MGYSFAAGTTDGSGTFEFVQGSALWGHDNVFVHITVCWPLPSNQSFYRHIAGCRMGVGDHRVGQ